jgi:regulator of protease activity HflC (stomatin/prohibitin superfamily)
MSLMPFRIVRPYQKGLVERLGKYSRTLDSGLNIVLPFVERLIKVDMREQVVDVPPQSVITKDNVVVEVDAVVYYEVTDPVKVTYNVADFYSAATKLAQTNLRNLVGDLALDESLTSREVINSKLREILDQATDKWGVKVARVELQRIEPPQDVTEAMHRQMKAERNKRATILEAEGQKQGQILEAEGHKEADILAAEGQAEAVRRRADAEQYRCKAVADGEAAAITRTFEAIHATRPTRELIALKYLETLQAMADGEGSKIFLPYEASGVLGSLAAMREIWQDGEPAKTSAQQRPAPPASQADHDGPDR